MKGNNNNHQYVTKKDLKDTLKEAFSDFAHRYIVPLYDKFDQVDRRFERVDQRFDKMDRRFEKMDQRFDKFEGIQLRMEQKLTKNIETLHDRDDAHDKKFREHHKRIRKLEKSTI